MLKAKELNKLQVKAMKLRVIILTVKHICLIGGND